MKTSAAPELPGLHAQYEREGYCVIPHLFEEHECRQWKSEALRVLREHAKASATVYVGAAATSPLFYALASHPRLVAVLREIMPHDIAFLSDKIVYKSQAQAFATPWHCDAAYWPSTRPKLSVWIALDAVSEDNGALKVLPGSHRDRWQHHDGDGRHSNNEFTQAIVPDWDAAREKVCELPQGGAIIFSDRLLHASCPNIAGLDRYSLISTYHAAAADEPFDRPFAARHIVWPTG
ncbi:MAG: phytanoyl-CoA hydroxylase [Abditibacteriota bacterium]|nr:phytanoyl-CoA hydroxylase [Abditibacteriota bacterium]